MPQPGTYLHDQRTDSRRYRLDRRWLDGTSYQLALGVDAEHDETPVVLKAIAWPDSLDEEARQRRREAAALEADILRRGLPGLPEGGDLVLVSEDGASEPVVVYRHIAGTTLEDHAARHFPDGFDLEEGLRIARHIADILDGLHDADIVFRGLHPAHILLTEEGDVRLVGTGHAGQRGARAEPVRAWGVPGWRAPEIAGEISGRFVAPRADVYSFGALLSWMFSGRRPTGVQEAPVTPDAWQRIRTRPEGVSLLVAHCMQPFHKKRLARMSRLLPLLHPDTLPSRDTPGFGEVWLLAPWSDGHEQTAARVGNLSPGPLVSRSASTAADDDAEDAPAAALTADSSPTGERVPEAPDPAGTGDAPDAPDDSGGTRGGPDERIDGCDEGTPSPAPRSVAPVEESARARIVRWGFSGVLIALAVIATAMRMCG